MAEEVDTDEVLDHPSRVRLEALRYAVSPEAATYLAVMRTFTSAVSGLLSDQSANEVRQSLRAQGLDLDLDVVDERLSYLVERGNLARSPRESEARSIREYLQTRARYQLTQRGELVHRLVEEVLGAADTAREVSSEMLAAIAGSLQSLSTLADSNLDGVEPEQVSREVITLFAQFERLVESTREFYAYLSEVLRRFDLDRAEFHVFKSALIGYLQRFVEEIGLHMPQIGDMLVRLEDHLPRLLGHADLGQRLVGLDGERAQRDRGLDSDDWHSLRSWFLGDAGRNSDALQVRSLATQAMSALLVNLRRIAASDDREASRYRDLIRLASWFEQAPDTQAHALWASAFGLYSCRHLGFPADEGVETPATASWWATPAAEVPMTLRQHGSRAMRGRPGRPSDFGASKARRLAERATAERERSSAVAELAALESGLDGARVSNAGRTVLLDLYARALASGMGYAELPAGERLGLVVNPAPGVFTRIASPSGALEFCDLEVELQVSEDVVGREYTA